MIWLEEGTRPRSAGFPVRDDADYGASAPRSRPTGPIPSAVRWVRRLRARVADGAAPRGAETQPVIPSAVLVHIDALECSYAAPPSYAVPSSCAASSES